MTKTETFSEPRSLSTQLTRRVMLLSLIGIIGLASAIILGLLLTLQQVQNRMDKVNFEAVGKFDLFFLEFELSSTENQMQHVFTCLNDH